MYISFTEYKNNLKLFSSVVCGSCNGHVHKPSGPTQNLNLAFIPHRENSLQSSAHHRTQFSKKLSDYID